MTHLGFMHQYYDWAAFEVFIKRLYEDDENVAVERDVTVIDRYGAKRQIDVRISKRTRFHQYITLVECKRWKEPVSRDRVDVLASSVEALNASNGAIFTTVGYEEGAVTYAKAKGIDLFVVRDLTESEWGAPGRHISLIAQICVAELKKISFSAQAIMLIDSPPEQMKLEIAVKPDGVMDADYDLFSVKTGERGPNLTGILADAHRILLNHISKIPTIIIEGKNSTLQVLANCELDFESSAFHQLRLPAFAARISKISFVLQAQISQTPIEIDRGDDLDFAVMIESYVNDTRLIAHKKQAEKSIHFREHTSSAGSKRVLENGMMVSCYCSPWMGLEDRQPDKTAAVKQNLRLAVHTQGAKATLTLVNSL